MAESYILVVDDDPQIASLLRVILGRAGWEVKQAYSGRQALDTARQDPPAVVVVDLWMPDMTGIEVLHELRAELELSEVPVILTTGDIEAPDAEGVFATLRKPFSIAQLYDTIRAALETCQP